MEPVKNFNEFSSQYFGKNIQLLEGYSNISEGLSYHTKHDIPIYENIYRYGSKEFFELINEARILHLEGKIILTECDVEYIRTDIGKKGIFEGKEVWLDIPFLVEDINEAKYQGKTVNIGKPKRGGGKAYYVYVKGCGKDKGRVKKVEFGSGMRAKINNPKARKSYSDRHGCAKGRHNNKCKAGYWSCRLPRYAKVLGLSGGGTWW